MLEEFAQFFRGPPARRSLGGMTTAGARSATIHGGAPGVSSALVPGRLRLGLPSLCLGLRRRLGLGRLRLGLRLGLVRLGRRRLAALAGGAVVVAATGALASPGLPTSTTTFAIDGVAPEPAATKLQHSRVLPYPAERVWPTTIRYLRVDRGFSVVDRDRDAGFILFEFTLGRDGEAKGRGSIELIETADASGRPAVKLQIATDAGPVHLPHAIADGLAAKLKAEQGQPAPPPPSAPPSPTPPPSPPLDEPDDGFWVPEDPPGQ